MRTAHAVTRGGRLVGEIMRPSVTAEPGELIRTVAARMRDGSAGAAAVIQAGHLAGILTERDLLRAIADGLDPLATQVEQVMTPHPVGIDPGASVSLAASRMVELVVRHLPVVERGQLVGMISARDIVTSGARYAASLAYEPW
jgi:CBS domain-containing protein